MNETNNMSPLMGSLKDLMQEEILKEGHQIRREGAAKGLMDMHERIFKGWNKKTKTSLGVLLKKLLRMEQYQSNLRDRAFRDKMRKKRGKEK